MSDSTAAVGPFASRPTHVRHVVLAALCLITAINYVQRNSLGGAETTVRAELNVTKIDTGAAMGAFFLAYALCQVPSGWLAQRWGGRRALTLYAAGWSVAMALSAAATSLPGLVGARLLMGVFQAGIFPCGTMILAAWYPETRRGFTSAMLNSFMLLGGILASWLTAVLIGPLGWRWLFLLYAIPGLVWAIWFARWFRNRPEEHPAVNNAELAIIRSSSLSVPSQTEKDKKDIKDVKDRKIPWGAVYLSSSMWLICIQQFCRSGSLRFFDMWLPTYLQEARGQSVQSANYWTSLPMVAGVLGGLTGGLLSDLVLARTRSRRAARQGVAIGSIIVALLIYSVAYRVADVNVAVLLASFGLLIWTFSSPVSYALSMDMGGRNLGVVFATMNMAGNLGSWAFTQFFPRFVKWGGWDCGLFVFAAMQVIAIIAWLPLNPNGIIGERAEALNSKE